MDRKEVLKSSEYWTAKAQIELYNQARKFMEKSGMNQTQLAEHLGVSKGYVSQLLNGDYDHRLSKFFELALAFGVVPQIVFTPVESCIKTDAVSHQFKNISLPYTENVEWNEGETTTTYSIQSKITACPISGDAPKNVA